MLKAKHFSSSTVQIYTDTRSQYFTSSRGALIHLDGGIVYNIDHIGIYDAHPPQIIINYHHLENYDPKNKTTPHHIASHRGMHSIAAYEMLCEHSIAVRYPDICLLRRLHSLGNFSIRKAIIQFIKTHKYMDISGMDFTDATWLMANILGQNEE